MAKTQNQAAKADNKEKTYGPLHYEARIHSLYPEGNVSASASVNINGCFAVRGVKVMEGPNGIFVSMPSYKSGDEYKDICFPCTKEARAKLQEAVLGAYEQSLQQNQSQEHRSGQEAQESPSGPQMTM